MSTLTFLSCIPVILLLVVVLSGVGQRPKGYPPGPPTLPLLGNLHQMPRERVHEQLGRWADQYGPIYSLILGTQVTIVLSSGETVKDLLDKKSAIYSSRPDLYVVSKTTFGLKAAFAPYGEYWRTVRRWMHRVTNVHVAASYVPFQDLENKQMLYDMLERPGDYVSHFERYTDSITTQLIYGHRSVASGQEQITSFFEAIDRSSRLAFSLGAAVLDLYPVLRNLPEFLFPVTKRVKQHVQKEKELFLEDWMKAKEKVQAGRLGPTFASEWFQALSTSKLTDLEIAYSLAHLREGGSETSAATLQAFVQAMLLYPKAQNRARAELDALLSGAPHRLPTMADAPQLPYLTATVKETLRWFPAITTGIPHVTTADDEYRGYRIPKGATVVMNIWTLNRDAAKYPSPRVFDPERFLGDTSTAAESAAGSVEERDHFSFGAGRRICPGMHIAERTLFLSVARLLWGFEFSKGRDAEGRVVEPDQDNLVGGVASRPGKFEAVIKIRSEEHAEVVRRAWEEAQKALDAQGQWREAPGVKFE